MWERVEKVHLLLVLTASIVALCHEYLVAFILSWISVGLTLTSIFSASSLSFLFHWRSFVIYISNVAFAIVLSVYHRSNNDSARKGVVAFAIISIVSCCFTSLLLYFLPVPSARRLNGKYQHIGTTSFEIPVLTEQMDGPAKKVMMPVQCWFPLETPSNPLQRVYQTYFQLKAALWTSGSYQQGRESQIMLKQIALIYAFPGFIFQHLGLSRTNSLHQKQPSGLPKGSASFPIAVYSHGMYGWRQVHHTCCEQLASHGFVVFAVDHSPDAMMTRPVEDLSASKGFDYFLPKGVEGPAERVFYRFGFNRRAHDIRTLLDFVAPTPAAAAAAASDSAAMSGLAQLFPHFKDRLNTQSVHLWGHSFGGGTVSTVVCRDTRVTSAVILDGWLYPMPDEDRQRGSVCASVLNVSSELWCYGKFQFPFRRDFIRNTLKNDSTGGALRAYNLVLTGTDHQNYCDANLTAGNSLLQKKNVLGTERNPSEVMQHLDNLIVAFFKKGDRERLRSAAVPAAAGVDVGPITKGDASAVLLSEPLLTQNTTCESTVHQGKLNYSTEDLLKSMTSLDSANNSVPLLPHSTVEYMKKYLVPVEELKDLEVDDAFFEKVMKGNRGGDSA